MKGTISILIALLLAGCSVQQDNNNAKRSVFVSIPPQAGLVNAIAGDLVAVRTLLGEGQSPHFFEPTAKQLTMLAEADLLFTIGAPYEKGLLNKIRSLYPKLNIVANDEQVIKRSMPHTHHGEHCTHDHGEKDPHIWLGPAQLQLIATSIFETLAQLDPKNQPTYRNNFQALMTELKELHKRTQAQLAPYQGSRFYVFHPSFGYFADQYDLQQIPIEFDGKSPSPRKLAELIEQARADEVKVIFVQKQFPTASAAAIAHALHGNVVQLDPLAEDSVANLRRIADSIAQALEP